MENKNQPQVPTENRTQVPEKTEPPMVGITNISVEYGRLRSITITTNHLEFGYSFFEKDNAVALEIVKRYDDYHRLAVNAFVSPKAAEELMIALFSTKYLTNGKVLDETREKWKHVISAVRSLIDNVTEIGAIRMGDDLVKGKHGIMITAGYEKRGDMYRINVDVEWGGMGNYICHIHETDLVNKEEVNRLIIYLEAALTLIDICK